MKNITLLLSIIFTFTALQTSEAQIWKKIQKKAEKKIEKKAEEKIDDVLDGKKKKDSPTNEPKKDDKNTGTKKDTPNTSKGEDIASDKNTAPEIWRNYKFIPGEKVIFYDDLKYEEVGEFPSRWDLAKGGAEVALFNGEKVIIGTADHHNRIIPLFDKLGYLGDEFTIEYDMYVDDLTGKNYNSWAYYNFIFNSKDLKYSRSPDVKLILRSGKTAGYAAESNFKLEEVSIGEVNTWHHVALSYYKGKVKLYFDDKRIVNLPKFDIVPDVFGIDMSSHGERNTKIKVAIKNIRIAHGGGQMYKRIMAEGKYVTNGILFDSGKAIIQSQSMGIINKVVTVMNENPDWKFQIIGHTDSDGPTDSNLTLSQQRSEAVKQALISQGIAAERLTTMGKGENEPLNTNSSPEEKANNRRVEFVKN